MKKLFIIIPAVLILGAMAYAGVQLYQNRNVISPIISNTVENKDEDKNTQVNSSSSETNTTSENIYKNTELGIQITLPNEITDFKTKVLSDNNGLSYVKFYLPINIESCNEYDMISENGKCYQDSLRLNNMTKENFTHILSVCGNTVDGPSCPDGIKDYVEINNLFYYIVGINGSPIYNITTDLNPIIDSLTPLESKYTANIIKAPKPNVSSIDSWSTYKNINPSFSLSYPTSGTAINSNATNEVNGVKSKGISFKVDTSKRYNNPNLKVTFSVLYTDSNISQWSCGKVDRIADFFLASYSPRGGSSPASQVVEDGKTYSYGYYFDEGMGSETEKEVYAFYKNTICYGVMKEITFIRTDAKQDYTSTDRDNITKDFKKFRDSLVIN